MHLMLPEDTLLGEWWVMGMYITRSKKNEPYEMLSPDQQLAPFVLPYKMLCFLVQLGAVYKAEQNIAR